MNKFLRKHASGIVWVVIVAFVIGGGLLGYGSYLTGRGTRAQDSSGSMNIATVNRQPVDIREYYQRLSANAYELMSMHPQQALVEQYEILNGLIERDLLLQAADKEKIKVNVTKADIDDYIERLKAAYELTQEQLVDALRAQGYTLAEYRKEIEELLVESKTIDALMDKVAGNVVVTDAEVVRDYEEVRISNIFISKTEDGRAKAEEALAKIRSGADFVQVVIEYSEAANTDEGGDIGFIGHEEDVESKKITDAAFALAIGEVSDVIETAMGFHILKVTDRKDAVGTEFEEVKEEIRTRLVNVKKAKAQSDWFLQLKKESSIVINIPELAGIQALIDGNFHLAIQKFEEAIRYNSEVDVYYSFLAMTYEQLGNIDKALETYERAIEIRPFDYENYYAAANLYFAIGDDAKGLEYLKLTSEYADDDYMARFQLKAQFESLGETALAEAEEAKIEAIRVKIQEETMRMLEAEGTE